MSNLESWVLAQYLTESLNIKNRRDVELVLGRDYSGIKYKDRDGRWCEIEIEFVDLFRFALTMWEEADG